jgi:hypothetical protein
MRVVTIAIAGVIISSEVRPDSEGGYQWIVQVAERTGDHRPILEQRGACGTVSRGDALDMAALMAHTVATGLASASANPLR